LGTRFGLHLLTARRHRIVDGGSSNHASKRDFRGGKHGLLGVTQAKQILAGIDDAVLHDDLCFDDIFVAGEHQ